jgi:hypothetical protein
VTKKEKLPVGTPPGSVGLKRITELDKLEMEIEVAKALAPVKRVNPKTH